MNQPIEGHTVHWWWWCICGAQGWQTGPAAWFGGMPEYGFERDLQDAHAPECGGVPAELMAEWERRQAAAPPNVHIVPPYAPRVQMRLPYGGEAAIATTIEAIRQRFLRFTDAIPDAEFERLLRMRVADVVGLQARHRRLNIAPFGTAAMPGRATSHILDELGQPLCAIKSKLKRGEGGGGVLCRRCKTLRDGIREWPAALEPGEVTPARDGMLVSIESAITAASAALERK